MIVSVVGGLFLLLIVGVLFFYLQSKEKLRSSVSKQGNRITECKSALSRGNFANEQPVEILGFDGNAMEVSVSFDERYLFFNDNLKNSPPEKDIHWAERTSDNTFEYRGRLAGVNSPVVDSSPDMDSSGNLYFTSLVDYGKDRTTTLREGSFLNGKVESSETITGNIYANKPRWTTLDPDVTPDGSILVYSEGYFDTTPPSIMNVHIARRTGNSEYTLDPNDSTLLKNLNTNNLEYAPTISADGNELFFTRLDKSKGFEEGVNIMVATRLSADETFCPPQVISAITGVVEAPSLSGDEKTLYYHKLVGGKFKIFKVIRQ
jgi:hypothetical protein